MACNDGIQRKDEKDVEGGYAALDAEGNVVRSAASGVASKSADYSIVDADRGTIILMDATGATRTASLPAVASVGIGFCVGVKKVDSSGNAVTVDTADSATIDGAASVSLAAQYDAMLFISDGSNWHVVAKGVSASGGVSDGDKGDVVVSSSGTVWTIDSDAVTNAKMANMAQATIKGRAAGAGTGDPTDLSVSQVAAILGLGGAATLNVGTTAGTVAAGDDSRLSDQRDPDIDGMTSETVTDRQNDVVPVYDASATANRKMALRDIASGVLERNATHVDVGPSSVAETSIFSKSILANMLGTDHMLRLSLRGTAKNQSGSGCNFQIRVKFGGATLLDFQISLASTGNLTTFHLAVELQNDGATGAQHVTAVFTLPTGSAPATGTAGGFVQAGGTRTVEGVGTVDTTSNQTFEVTLQLSQNHAQAYADIERAILELI